LLQDHNPQEGSRRIDSLQEVIDVFAVVAETGDFTSDKLFVKKMPYCATIFEHITDVCSPMLKQPLYRWQRGSTVSSTQ
jgi:hypothetical protein